MAKFKVGDKVEIRNKKEYLIGSKEFSGKTGIINELDYTSVYKWIRVHLGKHLYLWFISSEVKHVTD